MSLVAMTGNQDIDGVLWGVKWDLAALTYGFATQVNQYFGYQVGSITGFEAFNAAQRAAGTDAVNQLTSLINLNITLASDPSQANLRFAEASSVNQRFDPVTLLPTPGVITTAVGTPPDDFKFPAFGHGDMFFNNTNYNTPLKGNFAYATIIHELGHAVGLKHGHITQNFPNDSFVIPALPAAHDSMEFSVMTYRSNVGGPSDHYRNEDFGYAQTWMMDDIAALQYLYGADFTTNAGNTRYSWNPTTGEMLINGVGQGRPGANRVFLTIWDGNGIDTYDMANYTAKVTINLNPGSFSITSQAQLAVLNTDDGIKARGNVFNALQFNGDVRSLIENALGGSGDDTITGNVAANDLRGNGGADTLNGLDGADKLFGDDGDDTLSGGTGADTMVGGLGNDTYIVDNAADTVSETSAAATEIDTVRSSVSFTLGAHIENLVLTGSAAIAGTGNTLANIITGNAAANRLDGGAGNDTLNGGLGNDTYVLADGADKVTDSGGTDLITSTITRTLVGFATIENLTLLGSAAINAIGNALANILTGNGAANTLNGGTGKDKLIGGLGNDTYVTDGGDTITEAVNGGTDRVLSSVGLTLGANLENLTLTGSSAINGNGNTLANLLTGNTGNNTLNGMAGADTMAGGAGNDTYYVDNAGDSVVEADNAGTDQIFSSIGYTLRPFVENLTLTGAANINTTANVLGNKLVGNSGNNIIDGMAGADVMSGGGGSDTFGFTTSLVSGNIDTITDFSVVADKIRLTHTIFNAIAGTGTLSAAQFAANASGTAQDANDHIIYETDTGKLFYDSNGSAAGGSVQFAKLSSGLALTANDFSIN
jgi:Ca2+-binding RTX toxin-like protein